MSFSKTLKQQEADEILNSGAGHVLLYGGSRSGKTFQIMRRIIVRAMGSAGSRHAVFRQRANAVRASIWHDTFRKVMKLCFPGVGYYEEKQAGYVKLKECGSEIWFLGLDDKDRTEKILAMEFVTLYFGECSQISYSSILIALTRLAQKCEVYLTAKGGLTYNPEQAANTVTLKLLAIYDCNPPRKQHWIYKLFKQKVDPVSGHALKRPHNYADLLMNPTDNPNLPAEYLQLLQDMPAEQRARFYEGLFGEAVEGALWNWASFKRVPRDTHKRLLLPDMRRIVVGVDPPASSGAKGAECGIVVAGIGADRCGYILDDRTMRGRPDQWASAAVAAYKHHKADCIVAEVNQGGDMVSALLKGFDDRVPVKSVRATRGKVIRAEPIASLYNEGKIYHVGDFGDLETQMTDFSVDFDVSVMGYSPDRVDALVWALTEVMLDDGRSASQAAVRGL